MWPHELFSAPFELSIHFFAADKTCDDIILIYSNLRRQSKKFQFAMNSGYGTEKPRNWTPLDII